MPKPPIAPAPSRLPTRAVRPDTVPAPPLCRSTLQLAVLLLLLGVEPALAQAQGIRPGRPFPAADDCDSPGTTQALTSRSAAAELPRVAAVDVPASDVAAAEAANTSGPASNVKAAAPAAVATSDAAPASGGRAGMTLEAQRIGGRTGEQLSASGKVRLRQGGITLDADRIDYTLGSDRARASGSVSLRRGNDVYSGPELDIDTETMEGYFLAPTFTISRTQGRGRADRADFLGDNRVAITGASYTTCRIDAGRQPAWELSASRMRLDFGANDGYAEGAVLRFYDVPILALPLLSFPVTDARKSGWLPPCSTSRAPVVSRSASRITGTSRRNTTPP
ncbi:MAG: LPS-assembly protein LptD [Burkholderiales bacterium]|nr:LPS-assembly protein LptD [Burkholderiales bacterium]